MLNQLELINGFRHTIVGLTSFGTGCGDPDYPGVYARVTEVQTWIQDTVTGTQTSDCKFSLEDDV